jgi:hypothetical protein
VCRRAVRIAGLRDPLCAADPVGSIAAFAVTTRLAGNVACDVACDVASDSNIDLALVVTRSARERAVLRCAAPAYARADPSSRVPCARRIGSRAPT